MTFFSPDTSARDAFIEEARSHIGTRSRVNRVNPFGGYAGYDGQPWAGSFLDYAAKAANLDLTSLVSTASALGAFIRGKDIVQTPRVGDIVFYTFSTDGPFSQPHIGLVTDASSYREASTFTAIEGQTSTGLPKGPQDADGVYERARYGTDVLAFARPKYKVRAEAKPSETVPKFRVSQFQPGKITKATEILQLALVETVGARDMVRGLYNAQTMSAVAAFQREAGHLTGNGQMDDATLHRLAARTGYRYFRPQTA